jgi:hypothetical protein
MRCERCLGKGCAECHCGSVDCCDLYGVIDTDANPRPDLTVVLTAGNSPTAHLFDLEDGCRRSGAMIDACRAARRPGAVPRAGRRDE